MQRQTALAALNQQLALELIRSMTPCVERPRSCAGCGARGASWRFFRRRQRTRCARRDVRGGARWVGPKLLLRERQLIESLRDADSLTTVSGPGSAGITLRHTRGGAAFWVESTEQRPSTAEDHAADSAGGTPRTGPAARIRGGRATRNRCGAAACDAAGSSPGGFAVRYHPGAARCRSAAIGTTSSISMRAAWC